MKVRWDADGQWELPADRTYCMFTTVGEINTDGQKLRKQHRCLVRRRGRESVSGSEGTEALVIGWPTAHLLRIGKNLSERPCHWI